MVYNRFWVTEWTRFLDLVGSKSARKLLLISWFNFLASDFFFSLLIGTDVLSHGSVSSEGTRTKEESLSFIIDSDIVLYIRTIYVPSWNLKIKTYPV